MAHDNQAAAKISGYLEKKGKMRMVSSWKKYWFVLEGRLLLYYRSKVEYEALGPCKGSITLGTPCNIKPALASSCIFQIETRSNTAILRAENRYEQEKWMQAILAALNQMTSSPTKMSHFRYSADDLVPTPTADNKMQKPVFSRQNTMPERIGKSPQNKNVIERIQMLGGQTYGGSLSTINKLATKIKTDSPKTGDSDEGKLDECVNEENSLYAKVDKPKENLERRKSVLVENSEYASVSKDGIKESNESVLVENETYTSADLLRQADLSKESPDLAYDDDQKREHIYQEIRGNSITIENSEYCSIADVTESSNLDQNDNVYNDPTPYAEPIYSEKIYEVLSVPEDKDRPEIVIYEEPALPPRPKIEDETASQTSVDQKPKKGNTLQKLARLVSDVKKDGRKRNSFVLRMFKKNRKSDTKEDDEPVVITKSPEDDDPQHDIKVLTELQKLLDNKKQIIEEKIKSSSLSEESPEDCSRGAFDDKIEYAEIDEEEKDKDIPSLPPKQRNISDYSLHFNEVTINNALNIPRPKLIQKPKKVKKCAEDADEKLKTIDEILDDLDNEKKENTGRQKVKELIEKFNDHCNCEEVELRKKNVVQYSDPSRHSDDLNILLEELSKVTNAPILTPGVTSSLISTPQPSEEWKNLIPIRKRRFSEPDYDIPRPHSALQIMPAVENNDNPMKPTRFFGPVLIDYNLNGDANEGNVSITPDSLEIDHIYQNRISIEEDRSLFSYNSHIYSSDMRTLDKRLTKEEIYSRPKSLTSGHASLSEYDHVLEKPNVESKREEYEDSLEYSQTLTSF